MSKMLKECLHQAQGPAAAPRGSSRDGLLRVASVCSLLPSAAHPTHGIFVQRRLKAVGELTKLRALRPIPWFPFARPLRPSDAARQDGIDVVDRRMFYLPAILKHLDSTWLERSIGGVLAEWHRLAPLDLIDAHFGFPEGVASFRTGKRLNVPVFITIRGVERVEVLDRKIGPQIVEALSHCAGVISVSDSLKEAVVARGVPADQVRVIPNAIDTAVFHPGDRQPARRGLGLSADATIIISVGNFKEEKGAHLLIPAFAQFRRSVPNAELVLIGNRSYAEPNYVPRLAAQSASLGLGNSVRIVGTVDPDRMGDWLRAADLFALATQREGRCNAVLEAIACGLPVVTTPAGDNAAMVAPPRNGLIVPFNDVDALAGALQQAHHTPWDRTAISRSVPQRTWADVAQETIDFFHERLGSR